MIPVLFDGRTYEVVFQEAEIVEVVRLDRHLGRWGKMVDKRVDISRGWARRDNPALREKALRRPITSAVVEIALDNRKACA